MAQDQVRLFKIVSPKDDVVIGLTTTEQPCFGYWFFHGSL